MSKLRAQSKKAPVAVEAVETPEVVEVETPEVETTVETLVETPEVLAPVDVNPANTLIEKLVATASTVEVAEIAEQKNVEPSVRINPNRDVRTYIGDQWYNLKAGKQVSVPKTVKEKLNSAGMLSPL